METPQPKPTRKSSNKCMLNDCNDKIVKIIGDCRFCEKKFCGRHRTVEAHHCEKIDICKKQHFEKNSNKLMGEKVNNKPQACP